MSRYDKCDKSQVRSDSDVCHSFFQVACETMLSGSDLLTNLRDTAGKGNVRHILKQLRVLCASPQ